MPESFYHHIVSTLVAWHRDNPRYLPWKETREPYLIWLSEIILQQTQVSQGIPYYLKFIEKYPSVDDLARASEEDVLKDWQGLGYNRRALNMLKAARHIASNCGGEFPRSSSELRTLPGVGDYTAAAIASFAYEEPVPVLDANAIRVACRLLGVTQLPGKVAVKRELQAFLQDLIILASPGEFNQALMNFGALQCKARNPLCQTCPLADVCEARKLGIVDSIPAKPAKKPRRIRYFHYAVVRSNELVIMKKRSDAGDIWLGMFDFPLVESGGFSSEGELQWEIDGFNVPFTPEGSDSRSPEFEQTLSHQKIVARFYTFHPPEMPVLDENSNLAIVKIRTLAKYPVPKVIDCYFSSNSIYL